ALQREANAIADAGGMGKALAAARAQKGSLTGPAISRLVLAGDPGAVEALRRVATALGEACGGFQAVLDPELFVIGGGVAQLGEDLLGPVRIAYETSLPGFGDRPVAEFAIAELGNDAGFIGVADLATAEPSPETSTVGRA
ncbi:MAG TPA: ROK family protein, partial [Actinomycetota bacterium]